MKKQLIILMSLFSSVSLFSQVGINTENPQQLFHTDGKSSAATTNPITGVPSVAQQVDDVVITNQGRIGIGVTTPTQSLDVNGNVRFRGVPEDSPVATDRVIAVSSDGTAKKIPTSNLNIIGDVKYGFQPTDHNGWFLLNGRSISSLPVANQSAANSLFTNNLPNATERLLKPKGSLGSTGGNSAATSVAIAQANLPKVTLTATTSSTGNHSHGLGSGNNLFTAAGRSAVAVNTTITGVSGLNSAAVLSNTNSAGAHTHSVSVPLNNATSQTPLSINTEDSYLSVNVFIYLGQ